MTVQRAPARAFTAPGLRAGAGSGARPGAATGRFSRTGRMSCPLSS